MTISCFGKRQPDEHHVGLGRLEQLDDLVNLFGDALEAEGRAVGARHP
jgi:hypothetical protein